MRATSVSLPRFVNGSAAGVFLFLSVVPLALMLGRSIFVEGEFTVSSYASLLTSSRELGLFGRTLAIGAGATAIAILIGVPFSFLATRTDVPFARPLVLCAAAALIIPPYFGALSWLILFPGSKVEGSLVAAVLLGLAHLPYVLLLTMPGFLGTDRRLEEAARLHRGWWPSIRHVTLPLCRPHVQCAAVFVFVFTITDYGVASLLNVNTYPVEVFVQFSAFYDEPRATATAVPLVLTAVLLLVLQERALRGRPLIGIGSAAAAPDRAPLGRWRLPALLGMLLVLGTGVLLPLGVLIREAGGLDTYLVAFRTSGTEILESALVSAAAATLVLPLAFLLGHWVTRGSGPLARITNVLTFVPFAVPGAVLGIGLVRLWNLPGLALVYGTWLMIVVALAARLAPFALRVMASGFTGIDPELEEAAVLSKVPWHRRVRGVLMPLSRRGMAAAWFVVFVLSFGELGVTLLVTPPGHEPLSVKTYVLMHYGSTDLVAALCVVLVAISLVVLGLLHLLVWRRGR